MEKPAAERVLMAWDAAVAAKRRVEGVGLDPIALIQKAERGEDVGDSQEVAELIEAYGRLRKELDDLAQEGFPSSRREQGNDTATLRMARQG